MKYNLVVPLQDLHELNVQDEEISKLTTNTFVKCM